MSAKSDQILSFSINVNNTVKNDVIHMIGSEMTSEFMKLQADIEESETTLGKTAKIVDIKLISADPTQTHLLAKVIFGISSDVEGCDPWPQSSAFYDVDELIEDCINPNYPASSGNFYSGWTHTVNFVGYEITEEQEYCYSNFGYPVIHVFDGTTITSPEVDEAYVVVGDFIDCMRPFSTALFLEIDMEGDLCPCGGNSKGLLTLNHIIYGYEFLQY